MPRNARICDSINVLLGHQRTFMDYYISAVYLRSVVYAEYAYGLLRHLFQESMIKHGFCSSSTLLRRLEYEKHIVRKLLLHCTQIVHCSKHDARVCVMSAKMLRSLFCSQRVDICPETYRLIPAGIQIIHRTRIHTDIYHFHGITTAYPFDICGRLMFFKSSLRYCMQILPVIFCKADSFLHKLFT